MSMRQPSNLRRLPTYIDSLADMVNPIHGAAYHTDVERYKFYTPQPEGPGLSGTTGNLSQHSGMNLADAAANRAWIEFRCPDLFVSFTSFHFVVIPSGTGDLYWRISADYAADGEPRNTHSDAAVLTTTAVTLDQITVLPDRGILGDLAQGDYVGTFIHRDAGNVLDTVNADVLVIGVLLGYIAEQ